MRTIIICYPQRPSNLMLRRIVLVSLMIVATGAQALEVEAKLVIKDHKFDPAELSVPANTKIKLTVENRDTTPEEFESADLNREKVVTGGNSIIVYLGPLDA